MTRNRTRLAGTALAILLASTLAGAFADPAQAFFWRREAEPAPVAQPALPPPPPPASLGDGPLQIVPGAAPAPATAAAPAPVVTRPSPADLARAPLPPRRPGDLPTPTVVAAAEPVAPAAAPVPPTPTTPTTTASTAPAAPAPVTEAPAAPAAEPVRVASAEPIQVASVAPATDAEIVAAANAYFNGIDAMSGRFVQQGSDGRRFTGVLYVDRPGKLRFEYDAPATIDVIADGSSVVVQDRQLGTQDLYPISQTPLKFLLGDRIALGSAIPVIGVERTGEEIDVLVQDRSTFAGTSDIRLTFDAAMNQLKEWRIVDAQGFETRVSLSGIQRHSGLDQSLFRIQQLHRFEDRSPSR